jgi:zinc protease
MMVINQILGDAQSLGRLGVKLIDQNGLAMGIYASMDASISEGPWSIRIRTLPGQVDRVLEAVREEMITIQSNGVTEDELTFAKRRLINLLPTQLESNQGIATQVSQMQLFELGENYLDWYPGMVESVTMERVKACLRTRLSVDQAAIVIVGPYSPK